MKCKPEAENCKQFNAPCRIDVHKSCKSRLNYMEPDKRLRGIKPVQRKPVNRIKIRLEDNPKEIIIKFPDKETLIKSLRELLVRQ